MPNIASILRAEIERMAAKAVKAQARDFQKSLNEQRKRISELQKQLADQTRLIERLQKAAGRAGAGVAARTVVQPKVSGFRRDMVRAIRKRFGITQGQLAALLGVQLNSVSLWETGRTVPRRRQQEALMAIRNLSKEEVDKRLKELGMGPPALGTGRRGRPPGTPSFGYTRKKKTARGTKASGSRGKTGRRKKAARKTAAGA